MMIPTPIKPLMMAILHNPKNETPLLGWKDRDLLAGSWSFKIDKRLDQWTTCSNQSLLM